MKKMLFAALVGGLSLVSCSQDDDGAVVNPGVDTPSDYTFLREENSTVNYNGQTTRLEMTKELLSSFNDFDTATEESLSNMFSNENNPFSSEDLNSSSKSIKSKIAASKAYFSNNAVKSSEIKNDFDTWISQQVNQVFPNKDVLAEPGVAGQIADGTSTRYVNGQGLELNQIFAKSLIGALQVDQMLNNYLSTAVLDEGDNMARNDQAQVEEGKNYTSMEHKWDEAYGYLYGDPSIPTANPNSVLNESEDKLLFNYLGRVDADSDFEGIAEETFEAFKLGRAAIVGGNYELRDQQAAIIQENISTVIAVRAVHYLQGAKKAINNGEMGAAFHELSEGFGFLYSLRFTHNPVTDQPYISQSELDIYMDQLLAEDGFWDVTPETLDTISENIAGAFSFTVGEAAE
jgi:hypothetical protein